MNFSEPESLGHPDGLRSPRLLKFVCDNCMHNHIFLPLQAAHHLKLEGLEDVTCKTVANMIKGVVLLIRNRIMLCAVCVSYHQSSGLMR